MTGLQVWLHPSSRTKSVASDQLSVANHQFLSGHWSLTTGHLLLYSAALRRTAAVVRNRCDVTDRANFNARRRQRAHCRFTSRPRAANAYIHAADAVIARHVSGVRGGLLGGKGRALARSAEAERP